MRRLYSYGTAYPCYVARKLGKIWTLRNGAENRLRGDWQTCASGARGPYSDHRQSMEPLPDNQRPEDEEPEIAGVVQPAPRGRRAFRPDAEAPPVDHEALTALWAKEIADPVLRRQLIANVARYRTWFEALHDVVMRDIARSAPSEPESSGEEPESGA